MISFCDVILPKTALTEEQCRALGSAELPDFISLTNMLEADRQALGAKQMWLGPSYCIFMLATGELIYRYWEAGQFVYRNEQGEMFDNGLAI